MQNQVAVKKDAAVELIRTQADGPQALYVQILDDLDVILGFSKKQGDVLVSDLLTANDTAVTDYDLPYDGDGSTVSFSGETLTDIVIPGTFEIEASAGCPAIKDMLADGNLYLDGPARVVGSGGSIAAMAGEEFTVTIDGGYSVLVTMGTEGTAAAAATKINTFLGSYAEAAAVDSNNVKITSAKSGVGSSVKLSGVPTSITTKIGLADADNSTLCGKLVYSTGDLTLAIEGYTPSAAGATSASVLASNAAPYNLSHGDTLIGDVDYGGAPSNDTATFSATAATATGSGGSFASLSNETFVCQVTGYDAVTVTMATESTQVLAIAKINLQLLGAHCETVDAGNVKIVSDKKGTGQQVILSSVAAGITSKLGLANGTSTGTGNVADIDAVTVAEIKTIVEAAWNNNGGVTVTAVGDAFKISSNTTGTSSKVKVDSSSTAETIFGLSTTAATGSAASSGPLTANYKKTSTKLSGPGTHLIKVPNVPSDVELVVKATGTAAGRVKANLTAFSPQ